MEVAARCGGEIVSVDSMQVYRGMDIGTAKASAAMQKQVPHHLLDIAEPEDDVSVAEFQRAGLQVLTSRDRVTPVICGGSGLHFRSLVDPLAFPPRDERIRSKMDTLEPDEARFRLETIDPDAVRHVDLANPRRVARALEIEQLTGLTPSQRAATPEAVAVRRYQAARKFVAVGFDPGAALVRRVEERFDHMLEMGLTAEIARIGPRLGRLASQAVGYKELNGVVDGSLDLAEGRAAAIRATMALAKRQRTFFRRDPRIQWIPWDPDAAVRSRRVVQYLDKVAAWNS
jgi:tRNA dimethylallyltransferase